VMGAREIAETSTPSAGRAHSRTADVTSSALKGIHSALVEGASRRTASARR